MRCTSTTIAVLLATGLLAACTATAEAPGSAPTPAEDRAEGSTEAAPPAQGHEQGDDAGEERVGAVDGCPPTVPVTLPPVAAAVPVVGVTSTTVSPNGWPIEVTSVTVDTTDVDPVVGATITTTLEQRVTALIDDFDGLTGTPDDQPEDAHPPSLEVTLTATRVDTTFVSVTLEGWVYLGGAGVHSLGDGLTFSSAAGRLLTLEDVGLGGACAPVLGAMVVDQLEAEGVALFPDDASAVRGGAVPMTSWSLQHDSLYVHFGEYEVGPGVSGAPVAGLLLADLVEATATPLAPGG